MRLLLSSQRLNAHLSQIIPGMNIEKVSDKAVKPFHYLQKQLSECKAPLSGNGFNTGTMTKFLNCRYNQVSGTGMVLNAIKNCIRIMPIPDVTIALRNPAATSRITLNITHIARQNIDFLLIAARITSLTGYKNCPEIANQDH